ncbi:MAG: hypothetical protein II117_04930 [Clostridia bacterium]|nr:hypothetical protein [Clostridia bacterium]
MAGKLASLTDEVFAFAIYLTPQILLDNGFEFLDGRYYCEDIVIEGITFLTKIGDKCNDNIYEVHKLQHVLRDYGHKELADNFIVKLESLNLCKKEAPELA